MNTPLLVSTIAVIALFVCLYVSFKHSLYSTLEACKAATLEAKLIIAIAAASTTESIVTCIRFIYHVIEYGYL